MLSSIRCDKAALSERARVMQLSSVLPDASRIFSLSLSRPRLGVIIGAKIGLESHLDPILIHRKFEAK